MKALILALALASVAPVAGAQTGISKQAAVPAYGDPISLVEAQSIVDRAIRASRAAGHRMAVAIVEPNGELVAFARMDDTQYGSILVAQRKATTAARYRTSTAALEERVLSGRTVTLGNEDVLPIAGGLPIVIDGRIVGAIGVSGASAAEDATIAAAALISE